MKAAVLEEFGSPLAIETLPDPVAGAGDVVVDVIAAGVASYAANVFNGSRSYALELPVAPGAGGIGRVRAMGPDATRLAIGDWVFCDPTVRARDDGVDPDMILQGWTYRTAAALPLHRVFHHGAFAERMRLPMENVTRLGELDAAEAGRWTALGRLLVPYGGLLAGELKAGETLVVNGATGGFGSAGVVVALAMGAARVVATGRNERTLAELARRFGPRVAPAAMRGVEADDRRAIAEAAGGPIDMVLDFLPREATGLQVRAAALAVRPHGRVVLMGGVRADGGEVPLPYVWMMQNYITVRGHFMYPREAVARMAGLVRGGLLDLDLFEMTEFALDEANAAVAHAAAAGPFALTVLRPDRP
jgi:alcohol dehydrogenase